MTALLYTVLFIGIIVFIYGIYLVTLINKDVSKYNLPSYVKNNIKPVCYYSIIIGIFMIISCVYLLFRQERMDLKPKSNFGFKFY